jgi:hypothetical protein
MGEVSGQVLKIQRVTDRPEFSKSVPGRVSRGRALASPPNTATTTGFLSLSLCLSLSVSLSLSRALSLSLSWRDRLGEIGEEHQGRAFWEVGQRDTHVDLCEVGVSERGRERLCV